jgi:hypothetical protein
MKNAVDTPMAMQAAQDGSRNFFRARSDRAATDEPL